MVQYLNLQQITKGGGNKMAMTDEVKNDDKPQ